jgi:hypothetical protein
MNFTLRLLVLLVDWMTGALTREGWRPLRTPG